MPKPTVKGLTLTNLVQQGQTFTPSPDLAVRGSADRADAVMARVNSKNGRRLVAIRQMSKLSAYAAEDAGVQARAVRLLQIGCTFKQAQERPWPAFAVT